MAIQDKTLAEEHLYRLVSQRALAEAYQANGQIKEEIDLLEHVVAINTMTLVEEHPSRLVSQHALAGVYKANGQIKETIDLLEHVVAIENKTLIEEDLSRLASQQTLAGAYLVNGQVKEAVVYSNMSWLCESRYWQKSTPIGSLHSTRLNKLVQAYQITRLVTSVFS